MAEKAKLKRHNDFCTICGKLSAFVDLPEGASEELIKQRLGNNLHSDCMVRQREEAEKKDKPA
jgi:hypothetical protein